MEKIKAIIVDDHKLFRSGLKLLLSETGKVDILAEAANGKDFLGLLDKQKPDIVFMDIEMPEMNGIEATQRALELYPGLNIVVLSMFGEEQYYNAMIEAGVKGFILKDSGNEELEMAILQVMKGGSFFSQDLLLNVIRSQGNGNNKESQIISEISEREREVLELICQGLSNQQIGKKLFISPRTAERHRANLMSKTGTPNSIGLALFAFKNKLVEI